IVPFSSISNMLRAGIWEYALTAGKYQDGSGNSYQPRFIQGTVSRGMGGDYTPYGGLLVADHYRSAVLGVGKSLGMFGAASFDTAWSDTELASGDRKQGASFRFLYSKSLNAMGTELQIAGYRYSTSGYYDFSDAVTERASYENGQYRNEYDDTTASSDGTPSWANTTKNYYYSDRYNNKRQRVELTVSQHLGPVSLYSTLTNQTYWGSGNRDRTLQVGLNSMYKDVSYGLFVQDSRSNYGQKDRTMNLTLSVPFTVFGQKPVTASLNMAHSKQSGDSYSTGMGGSLLDDNRLNYYLQTGHAENGGQTTMADVGYMGSMGNAQVGYSWNENYSQSSLNLSGGVLAHRGGVTLSQPMQNTIVLVEARDAKGVRLENQPGVAVDRFGYAVMTSATAYRHNRVALNTEDIGAGLDIPLAARDVVPTYGAISRVTFETRTGQSLLLHLKIAEGNYPAIGATVFNDAGANIGTVGTTGTAYVSGVSEHQHLQVKWGEGAGSACEVVLPGFKDLNAAGYQELSLACTPK
ncbi:fimbria/pilus outer membrane usher protein, partial [Erwinia sp. B116]